MRQSVILRTNNEVLIKKFASQIRTCESAGLLKNVILAKNRSIVIIFGLSYDLYVSVLKIDMSLGSVCFSSSVFVRLRQQRLFVFSED